MKELEPLDVPFPAKFYILASREALGKLLQGSNKKFRVESQIPEDAKFVAIEYDIKRDQYTLLYKQDGAAECAEAYRADVILHWDEKE
jgi:hypothetical protein